MKARREVTTSQLLLGAANLVPAAFLPRISHLLAHQPLVNLVVTNVPGPAFPLYAMAPRCWKRFRSSRSPAT